MNQIRSQLDVLKHIYALCNGSGWTDSSNWNSNIQSRDIGGEWMEVNDGCICYYYNQISGEETFDNPFGKSHEAISADRTSEESQKGRKIFGVSFDSQNVVEIDLSFNKLNGNLPADLGNLVSLRVLNLRGNQLRGTIPKLANLVHLQKLDLCMNLFTGAKLTGNIELNNLANLTDINLSDNQFSGDFPTFGNLANLRDLSASNNRFTGKIPPLNFPKLERLMLSGNQLSGEIPKNIGFYTLTNLSYLNLSSNMLSGEIPSTIGSLVGLVVLNLKSNQLTGSIPETIASLVNLQEVDFSGNRLSGSIPNGIGNLSKLEILQLNNNTLTGAIPFRLQSLAQLRILYLQDNQLSHSIPNEFVLMTNLKKVNLSRNKISGIIPQNIENLSLNLTDLKLSNNQISGLIPEGIVKLVHLTVLKLHNNSLSGPIPSKIGKLSSLRMLTLNNNSLSGEIPISICNLLNIYDLRLHFNELVKEIPFRIGNLSTLSKLYLNNNKFVGKIPESLGNLTDLTELYLDNNKLNGNIPSSIGNLINLKELKLHNNNLYGDIPSSLASCVNLLKLDLSENSYPRHIVKFFSTLKEFKKSCVFAQELESDSKLAEWIPPEDEPSCSPGLLCLSHVWFYNSFALSYSENPLVTFNQRKGQIFHFFRRLIHVENVNLLYCLIVFRSSFTKAAEIHVSQQEELLIFAERAAKTLSEIFASESFDDPNMVKKYLLGKFNYFSDLDNYTIRAIAVDDSAFLGISIERKAKFVFAYPQIMALIDKLLLGTILWEPNSLSRGNTNMVSREHTPDIFFNLRACPIFLFLFEGVCKFVTLALISITLRYRYRSVDEVLCLDRRSGIAIGLLVMIISGLFYEIGQLRSVNWKIKPYTKSLWNKLDVVGYIMLIFWGVEFCFCFELYRAVIPLALSAIPFSIGMLQYVSMSQTLGQLVIMVEAMMLQVINFVFIFFVSIFGFVITFYSLFRDSSSYSSSGDAFLTLFNAALGSFTFDDFNFDKTLNIIGQTVLIFFVTYTAIILLNLLIARMSSTHNKVERTSKDAWAYYKIKTLKQYLLFAEHSPLNMLPPPFNVLTILVWPLHLMVIKDSDSSISVCGTCSNFLLMAIGYFPRIILKIREYYRLESRKFLFPILKFPFLLIFIFCEQFFYVLQNGSHLLLTKVYYDSKFKQHIVMNGRESLYAYLTQQQPLTRPTSSKILSDVTSFDAASLNPLNNAIEMVEISGLHSPLLDDNSDDDEFEAKLDHTFTSNDVNRIINQFSGKVDVADEINIENQVSLKLIKAEMEQLKANIVERERKFDAYDERLQNIEVLLSKITEKLDP